MTTAVYEANYYSHFPSKIRTLLEAGAFRALCQHLRERSDDVQNIDLMSISGFCRNCLAKWLVMEARKLIADFKKEDNIQQSSKGEVIAMLESYDYSSAAQFIYGCDYSEWKKVHNKKARDEQIERYKESVPLHAKHDDDIIGCTRTTQSTEKLPELDNIIEVKLEAGAFQSICTHLRDRSEEVQNIDLMTISGFCRNCLAKWLVLEARKLSKFMRKEEEQPLIQALGALGYNEAAEEVYGRPYSEWKKIYPKKATDEQMAKYKSSEYIHAEHDMEMLKASLKKPDLFASALVGVEEGINKNISNPKLTAHKPPLLSDVCCEEMEPAVGASYLNTTSTLVKERNSILYHNSSTFSSPPPPNGPLSLSIAILTVSDRAASNDYEMGDLSGPKLEESILSLVDEMNKSRKDSANNNSCTSSLISCDIAFKAIVPDETKKIQHYILTWSGKKDGGSDGRELTSRCDVIFTTGGTGFSPRDVTPEATLAILDRECRGLMPFCFAECSLVQPLAALSRGSAGVCGQTIVANLPGNPVAIAQVIDILFPLLLHAVKDLKGT